MKKFWDDRYGEADSAYGEAPNRFFKEQLDKLRPGKILLPAEGAGRNAIFAAQSDWQVDAFDISETGKEKAESLADKAGVQIHYQINDLNQVSYPTQSFDCLALIFAHFPAKVKSSYHQILNGYVKKGGVVIFEAFSKLHLALLEKNPAVGGPKNMDMLFSREELVADFSQYDIDMLEEKIVTLNEGQYHQGESAVIRLVATKK